MFGKSPHPPIHEPPIKRSLSTRLLYLTIGFVLIAEAFVLLPSLAKHRLDWLNGRVEAAYLVSLALSPEEGKILTDEVADQLLQTANIKGVRFWQDGQMSIIRVTTIDPERSRPIHFVDLANRPLENYLTAPWAALFSSGDDLISVQGTTAFNDDAYVNILVSQAAQRADLWIYLRNILILSLIISAITAGLLYTWLNKALIRPVNNLLINMAAFEENPEDPNAIIVPGGKFDDELLEAQRGLASMEQRTHTLLEERRRLAALGAGISKISHDLRNILASAQLMSDRLAKSDDARVRRLSPRLISALGRAISLSKDTISFAQMGPSHLKKETVDIHKLVDDVFDATASMTIGQMNETPVGLVIQADPTQLYRAIFNIIRNANDAMEPDDGAVTGATTETANDAPTDATAPGAGMNQPAQYNLITIKTSITGDVCTIDVCDTGPGLPDEAKTHLFEPFKGSMKPGGSGLGVAIASEIARAHGGRLSLASSDENGSIFRFTLPVGNIIAPSTDCASHNKLPEPV